MPDEGTSSDTLRDRLEEAKEKRSTSTRSGLFLGVAVDAIEYAAQLERSLAMLTADPPSELERTAGRIQAGQRPTLSEGQQLIRFVQRFRAERDEARAERDRALDALEAVDGWLPWHEPSHPDYKGEKSDAGRAVKRALREVERGDTVDQIRREAYTQGVHDASIRAEDVAGPEAADAIRALAEDDDQEDESDA